MGEGTSRIGRAADGLRDWLIEPNYLTEPWGSALVTAGRTVVLCTATVEPGVPGFLMGKGRGWASAEYAMLPASTGVSRKQRGADGRSREIGRMIGRAVRAALDLSAVEGYTISIDCDVLQAHGGTRTASITGGWVALRLAAWKLMREQGLAADPVKRQVAAVSVGLMRDDALLDLDKDEDQACSTDFNVVMNDAGRFVEIQGAAEDGDFDNAGLDRMLSLARKGLKKLFDLQRNAIEG